MFQNMILRMYKFSESTKCEGSNLKNDPMNAKNADITN